MTSLERDVVFMRWLKPIVRGDTYRIWKGVFLERVLLDFGS